MSPAEAAPPVRNENPEQPAVQTTHIDPIYYPLNPRREAAAETETEECVVAEDLLRQFMEYHTSMKYEDAAEIALELVGLAPDRPLAHYNLACAMGRLNRIEESLDALEMAVDCGWRNTRHTVIEPDLVIVRGTDRFAELVKRMERLADDERIDPTELRDDPVETIAADLQREAVGWLERYHVPGVTMALVRDGAVAWEGSFGLKDKPAGTPMKTDDLFQLAAPADLLVLVAALKQEASGGLSLPHLLVEAAELSGSGKPAGRSPVIVRPTAGGGRSVAYLLPYRDSADNRDRRPSTGAARSRGSDSQTARSLLCFAVEVAAESSYPRYCRQEILAPLGMDNTSFGSPEEEDESRLAVGHSRLGTPTSPLPRSGSVGASVLTSAGDLGRLIAGLMTDQSTALPRIDGDQLKRVGAMQDALPGGLGLAIYVRSTPSGLCAEVTGNSNGVGCLARFYPEKNVGVAIMFNSETGLDAARRLAHLALGGI